MGRTTGHPAFPARSRRQSIPTPLPRLRVMDPAERVRWACESARAVLDGRLTAADAARALAIQQEQLADLLRSDRSGVTARQSAEVATRLRLLAEQVADSDHARGDPESHQTLARALGRLADVLR